MSDFCWAGMVVLEPESLKKRCGFRGKGARLAGREALTAVMQVLSRSSTQRGSSPALMSLVTAFAAA